MTFVAPEHTTRLLVVDDESDILPLLEFCLKPLGMQITTCTSARSALTMLREQPFDVVLSDVMMPDLNGLDFLAELRTFLPDTPVILMSGFAQLDLALSAMKQGAYDLVQKPFDFDLLRGSIRKAAETAYLRHREREYQAELESMIRTRTEELQLAIVELETARDRIKQAAEERDRFVAAISHEMRTPMNGIVGPLELLEEADLTSDQRSFLGLARTSADRMTDLVNQMIKLASQAFDEIDPITGHRLPVATAPTPEETTARGELP